MMPVRSDFRSKRENSGRSSWAMNMVGTHRASCIFLFDGLQRRERIKALARIDHGGAEGHGGEVAHTMPKQ